VNHSWALTLRCGLLVCFCRVQLRKLIQDEDGSVTAASDQLQHLIRLAAVDKDKVSHQHGRPSYRGRPACFLLSRESPRT
jgi:hypothetical protein